MTAKASGQLSGAVDELNWIATAKPMPYWNGSAWITATSRTNGLSNPGAQILQLARGIYDENGELAAGLGWRDGSRNADPIRTSGLDANTGFDDVGIRLLRVTGK